MINLRTREGWDDLKRLLDERPYDVLALCGIDVKRLGNGWTVIDDPLGQGGGNFGICMRGGFLTWKNFSRGVGGRSLELIAYCRGIDNQPNRGAQAAADLAISHFRLGHVSNEDLAKGRAQVDARRAEREDKAAAEADRKTKAAFGTFANAAQLTSAEGTAGWLVWTYLREARGIDMMAAPFRGPRGGFIAPSCLRAIERCEHFGQDGRRTFWPAMVACCVDADMHIRAIHRTWLRQDGSDKAPVIPSRKVWPDFAGCVIPLWNGEDNLPVRRACEIGLQQTIVLTEGVEDGLSAVLANPKHRVWAAISLSNIANVAARLPACCDSVIVHRQNDWDKPAAVAAFEAALTALRATDRAVAIVEAYDGKDLNDTLRGEA